MKILLIHNQYRGKSGEEIVVAGIHKLLELNNHDIFYYSRNSEEIATMPFGNIRAFLSGIYSFPSRKKIRALLKVYKPDIVHIHNLFPLISPSILPECKYAGVPVVMTVHNYRLVCPNGLHMVNNKICERCNKGKEHWCFIKRCERNYSKSIGYALRNFVARKRRFYLDNVTRYATLTEFQKNRLIDEGFDKDKISVIPNIIEEKPATLSVHHGEYVGFIGRISPEKDISSLINAAKHNADIPFKAAGAYDQMPDLLLQAPINFDFLGFLDPKGVNSFYDNSQIIVLCSICFEGFPMVLVEAMFHGKAIICSRIGGLPEIIDDGVTGLLFEPGNVDDLSKKIRYLWNNPKICKKMGKAGREKALREYSSKKYYKSLLNLYEDAIAVTSKK